MRDALYWLAILAIPLLLTGGAALMVRWYEWIRAQTWNELAKGVAERVSRMAWKAVSATAQRWVDSAKAKSADGKLTDEEASEALGEAIAEFKRLMGKRWLDQLLYVAGAKSEKDLDAIIAAELESVVAARKELSARPLAASPPLI